MKRILFYLLLFTGMTAGCKKKEGNLPDPLHKRWFLHKIERQYTDKSGNPHPNLKPQSNTVDNREMFFEFTAEGKFLTYEGNGTYQRTGDRITFQLPQTTGEYGYQLQQDELILTSRVEGITYNENGRFTLKPL